MRKSAKVGTIAIVLGAAMLVAACSQGGEVVEEATPSPTMTPTSTPTPGEPLTDAAATYASISVPDDATYCQVFETLIELKGAGENVAAADDSARVFRHGLETYGDAATVLSETSSSAESEAWGRAAAAYSDALDLYVSVGENVANTDFIYSFGEAVNSVNEGLRTSRERAASECALDVSELVARGGA